MRRKPLGSWLGLGAEPSDEGEDGVTGHYTHSAPLASWVLLEHCTKKSWRNNTVSHVLCIQNGCNKHNGKGFHLVEGGIYSSEQR